MKPRRRRRQRQRPRPTARQHRADDHPEQPRAPPPRPAAAARSGPAASRARGAGRSRRSARRRPSPSCSAGRSTRATSAIAVVAQAIASARRSWTFPCDVVPRRRRRHARRRRLDLPAERPRIDARLGHDHEPRDLALAAHHPLQFASGITSPPFSNRLSLSIDPDHPERLARDRRPGRRPPCPGSAPGPARAGPRRSSPGPQAPPVEDRQAVEQQPARLPAVGQHADQVRLLERDGVHQRRRQPRPRPGPPASVAGQPLVEVAGELVADPRPDDDQVDPPGSVDRQERPLEAPARCRSAARPPRPPPPARAPSAPSATAGRAGSGR